MLKISGKCKDLKKQEVINSILNMFNEEGVIYGDAYIGYPVYSIEFTDKQLICDLAVVSNVGFFVINIIDSEIIQYGDLQDDLYNKIDSKLKRHNFLVEKRRLYFNINVLSYSLVEIESLKGYPICFSLQDLKKYIDTNKELIYEERVDQISSGIQESYGLNKKIKHELVAEGSKATLIDNMNKIIEKYDNYQMDAIMDDPIGVQRIRGMAGSGKTVVLARKAVELHILHPEWTIGVTYYTRSLQKQLIDLIDRFYSIRTDGKRPNYNKLKVMHAWGSLTSDGLYYDICKNLRITPLTYNEAKRKYPVGQPFDYLCEEILKSNNKFKKLYDCILIDEAQDFNNNFLKLCCKILGKERRLAYAYDELQKLNELSMDSPKKIFGFDISKDTPLVTCYRNQSSVIVTAHALGMGLYREDGMIQIPSSTDVWESIGYKVDSEIVEGEPVTLYRNKETSPDFLPVSNDELIKIDSFSDSNEVYEKLLESIYKNISDDGLNPNDIMIIDLDGINSSSHFSDIQYLLYSDIEKSKKISIHMAGSSNPEDFFRKDSIVFSTIFRAKGNEAYYVYIINSQKCIDTLTKTKDRNSIFTAITRSKGWVRVYGYGSGMDKLCNEFDKIKEHDFQLYFNHYPTKEDRKKMVLLNKDISKNDSDALISTKKYIDDNQSDMEILLKELFGEQYKNRLREFVLENDQS